MTTSWRKRSIAPRERALAEICAAIETYTESMRVLRMVNRNPNQTDELASDD
ncbi:hypothetical protein [Bosea sp. BK604]|uniref:hypothetical protein n=1 Tax=Bosea sp. BK604 TaxID=2512180 RepID=UPI0010D86B50|nr:hypothetical protein [Bosea sp. BK604]TCR65422.1 hypothetical protein EV560_105185 [Bosea sp. BK604]